MKKNYKDMAMRDERESVFDQLFREHFHALSFFARSIIGQELFAQDIVQECFIKVWSRRRQLINLSGLKSYLYAAVKNDCISYLRRQVVKNRKYEVYLEKIAIEVMPPLDKEIIHGLYNCVERLPEKMREVIQLYYLEEMSSGAIGRILQKNPDTVQRQRKSALRLLRNEKRLLRVA